MNQKSLIGIMSVDSETGVEVLPSSSSPFEKGSGVEAVVSLQWRCCSCGMCWDEAEDAMECCGK